MGGHGMNVFHLPMRMYVSVSSEGGTVTACARKLVAKKPRSFHTMDRSCRQVGEVKSGSDNAGVMQNARSRTRKVRSIPARRGAMSQS